MKESSQLLRFTHKGLYVPMADIYIDPWMPVPKALITHAHSDHARSGHNQYISCNDSVPLLKLRLGSHITIAGYAYGEKFTINGVKISFHPAGHIIGSAQIRLEYKETIVVVSGDYKRQKDGISGEYEVVPCHTFVTESTFGIPAFRWPEPAVVFEEINHWWQRNAEEQNISVIAAYSLGKAQRILNGLSDIGPIYCHTSIDKTNEVIKRIGTTLKRYTLLPSVQKLALPSNAIIICPPSIIRSAAIEQLKNVSTAAASGWMALRGTKRRSAVDKGFVLSDHADWSALNQTVIDSGADQIFVTHGYTDIFSRWLNEKGYQSSEVKTEYGDNEDEL